MRIKVGDQVVVISGKDKGKKGKVIEVHGDRVSVEGVNIVSKHEKPSQANMEGGIVKSEAPIHRSNVMLFDEKAGKGVRVKAEIRDGKKVRVSKQSGEVL